MPTSSLVIAIILVLPLSEEVFGFQTGSVFTTGRNSNKCRGLASRRLSTSLHHASFNDPYEQDTARSRRGFLQSLALALPISLASQSPVQADDRKPKILVLGGTGFVGSRVVSTLNEMRIDTIATSRDGRDGTRALDFTKSQASQVESLAAGCTAVISCIGSIGTPDDLAVNAGTGQAAKAAKAAGVDRFVYITVAPEVQKFARDIDFLKDYMQGKAISREVVLASFRDKATLIEPTFIYGGGSFELSPPRVAGFYGQFIEGLLSSSPIRSVERILSPGIFKIALEPPIPVEAVANAAIAGALGKTAPVLDTYDKIKQASALV